MKKIFTLFIVIIICLSFVGCSYIDPIYDPMYIETIYTWNGTAWNSVSGGGVIVEADPLWSASPSFGITAGDILNWDSLISSQWVTDANGIHYNVGSVGLNTNSSNTRLLYLYSNNGVANDPVLHVHDNSASGASAGIYVGTAGAKTGDSYGINISNATTSNTGGLDKYGLYITVQSLWNGVGAKAYGLYVDSPTGATENITAHFGNATNYVEWSDDGTMMMYGDSRTTNTIWLEAGGLKAPGAKPATMVAHGVLETPAWQFSAEEVAGNQETISFNVRIPERMDRTVEPTLLIGWSTTPTSGNVTWQLEYVWRSINEDTTVGAEETLTQSTTVSVTAEGLCATTFTGINVPSGTDICMHCRITRLSADATDTVNADVELHGICFSWTSNKLGG